MAKRPRDSNLDVDVSEIESTGDNVTVHGFITALSPVKKSKTNKYFNARLSDGKKTMRVVSFNPTVHDTLQDYHHKSAPIALTDCLIKHVAS